MKKPVRDYYKVTCCRADNINYKVTDKVFSFKHNTKIQTELDNCITEQQFYWCKMLLLHLSFINYTMSLLTKCSLFLTQIWRFAWIIHYITLISQHWTFLAYRVASLLLLKEFKVNLLWCVIFNNTKKLWIQIWCTLLRFLQRNMLGLCQINYVYASRKRLHLQTVHYYTPLIIFWYFLWRAGFSTSTEPT